MGADLLHFCLPVAPGFMSLKAEACPLRHLWQYGSFECKDNYIKHSPASLYGHPFTKLCFNNVFVPLFTVVLGQLQCLSFVSQHLVGWLALFIEQIGEPAAIFALFVILLSIPPPLASGILGGLSWDFFCVLLLGCMTLNLASTA